jgi:hypothetical protein
MIEFQFTSNAPEGNKERNACTVNALSIAAGVPWLIAHRALARAGRKNNRGISLKPTIEQGKLPEFRFERIHLCRQHARAEAKAKREHALAWEYPVELGPKSEVPWRVTMKRFIREHPAGRYLVLKRRHAFAIVNGKARDWQRNGARTLIKHAWKVTYIGQEKFRA